MCLEGDGEEVVEDEDGKEGGGGLWRNKWDLIRIWPLVLEQNKSPKDLGGDRINLFLEKITLAAGRSIRRQLLWS